MTQQTTINISRIHQIISLIDLTDLSDDSDQSAIESLCTQARTPVGPVAAICIWPRLVSTARTCVGVDSPIQIATVVNFPSGNEPAEVNCNTTETAIKNGATEIDYVLPYSALIDGNIQEVTNGLRTIRDVIPADVQLKVILETGILETQDLIQKAATIAIDEGADFIKTSTGKVPINATTEAASTMLDIIKQEARQVGFKAAGGIRSIIEADAYLTIADEKLGQDWANAKHFRFGASSLLVDALNNLQGSSNTSDPSTTNNNY